MIIHIRNTKKNNYRSELIFDKLGIEKFRMIRLIQKPQKKAMMSPPTRMNCLNLYRYFTVAYLGIYLV